MEKYMKVCTAAVAMLMFAQSQGMHGELERLRGGAQNGNMHTSVDATGLSPMSNFAIGQQSESQSKAWIHYISILNRIAGSLDSLGLPSSSKAEILGTETSAASFVIANPDYGALSSSLVPLGADCQNFFRLCSIELLTLETKDCRKTQTAARE